MINHKYAWTIICTALAITLLACTPSGTAERGRGEPSQQSDPLPSQQNDLIGETALEVSQRTPPETSVPTLSQPYGSKSKPSSTLRNGEHQPMKHIPTDLMSKIKLAASDESGVPSDQLEVLRAEQVTWPDGSLGCPQPGMTYTQALVDGYWIVLRAGKSEFDYRASTTGAFVRCTNRARPSPPGRSDL